MSLNSKNKVFYEQTNLDYTPHNSSLLEICIMSHMWNTLKYPLAKKKKKHITLFSPGFTNVFDLGTLFSQNTY